MRKLFLLLLFAVPCFAQDPQWVNTPAPHWSCPDVKDKKLGVVHTNATYFDGIDQPVCIPVTGPALKYQHYDIEKYERIGWSFTVEFGRDGLLYLNWPQEFAFMPGCMVFGDDKDHIAFVEQSKKRLVLSGKPGLHLSLSCLGLLPRTTN